MPVSINFLTEDPAWRNVLKLDRALWKTVIQAALAHPPVTLPEDLSINVLLSDNATVQRLNRDYRDKDKPTNILSFPQIEDWNDVDPDQDFEPDEELGDFVLGDLIAAWGVVEDEAKTQNKPIRQHMAHLLVHGTLHLLGYDHMDDGEAEAMEALETEILAAHDIPDPYLNNT
jgi:probable rRNA maturation factor